MQGGRVRQGFHRQPPLEDPPEDTQRGAALRLQRVDVQPGVLHSPQLEVAHKNAPEVASQGGESQS